MYTSDLRKIFNIIKGIIENRQGSKKITIQDLTIVWNQLKEEEDVSWKEEIPEIFTVVIDTIKREGGKCHSYRVFELLSQKKVSFN